jgi:hypothetical protein
LFYSQTWLNLVPALFGHAILTDPGVNVTAHRLAGEDFAGTDERSSIAGQRLRLFHFTGFDPAHPDLLSSYDTVGLGERPRLAALCRDYAARVIAHGWPERTAYGWGTLPGGLRVDEVMAGIYAGSLLAAERGLGEEPPDPFDHAHPGAFVDWLRDPPAELSRYLLALHAAREDLRTAFPGVPGPSTADFARWASGKADQHAEPEIPRELASVRRSGAGPHDP